MTAPIEHSTKYRSAKLSIPEIYVIRPNLTRVDTGNETLWFSYTTLVAFCRKGVRVVAENKWSNTTARHLCQIDGGTKEAKLNRIGHSELLACYQNPNWPQGGESPALATDGMVSATRQ